MHARPLMLLSCFLFLLVRGAGGAQQPAEPFTLKQIGPTVWAAINNTQAKAQAGGNAGFVIGDDGVVVIDTFVTSDAATQLLAEIRKLTKLSVKFAINTHYHADHVAGNRVFADAGAVVLAQRNVRNWIHSENLRLLPEGARPELNAFIESLAPPTVGYEGSLDLRLGSRAVQVVSFPGHTGGDSVVFVPDAKVAFAGDLFWRNSLPNMVNASTRPWIDTLDRLNQSAAGFTFVPGHGDVGTAQDVMVFRDYLATLQKLVADARARGSSGKAISEAVMPALQAKYGQWDYFTYLAPLNIEQMDAELSGTKRVPQSQPMP